MRSKAIARRLFYFLTSAIILLLAPAAEAKILIDFGNNVSYRSASTGNPDVNGNYWNSVDSSKYWSNLLNADNSSSLIGFGFSSAPGADSYNGPAGATTGSNNVANVVINVTALGDFGVYPAAFDYYVSSTFTIQQLNSAKVYDLTFFGSHKYSTDNTTVYTVYTANDYAMAVASASLLVGVNDAHNQDKVVTISNVAPQTSNSIWVGFKGSAGNSGYLNAMRINEITPDGTWNGGGANNDTMTDANWTNGRYPAAVASGVMRFAGSSRTTPNVNYTAGSTFGSIYFNSGAAAFTVGGNALTLNSLIENDSASVQTINNNLTMGAAISLNATAGSLTLGGIISGGASYTITKTGTGTLTLSGVNTYSGATTISDGTLTIGGTGQLGSGTYAANITDNAAFIYNSSAAQTLSGAISGSGTVTKQGAGTLKLTGANTFGGALTISAGTLQIGDNGTLGSVSANIVDNAALTFYRSDNVTCESAISGTGTLSKQGAGILTLSGNNTYSGGTTVSVGTLKLGIAGALADAGNVTVSSGAVFDLNGKNEAINALTLNGTGISSGGALVNSSGTAAILTLGATSSLALDSYVGGSGDITIDGTVAIFNSATRTLTKVGNNTLTLSNGANLDNQDLLMAVSAGTVVLNKTSSATAHCIGGLTVNSGGTVKLSGSGGYQIWQGATPTVNSGGVLDMNGQNQTFTPNSLTISGDGISSGGALVNNNGSASTLTSKLILGANSSVGGSGTLTISDVISGVSIALTKVGAGTLILSVANTYSGATTVNAGTLRVDGSLAAGSAVAVNAGGTLGGSGTVGGAVTVMNGASVTPGASVGTLTVGSLDLRAGSVYTCEFASASSYDKIAATGALTLPGSGYTTIVIPEGATLQQNTDYDVITCGSKSGANIVVDNFSSFENTINIVLTDPNKVTLHTTPEPGVIVLEAMLLLAIRGIITVKGRKVTG